jgi:tetratricopeptide (TPR) repeat protein
MSRSIKALQVNLRRALRGRDLEEAGEILARLKREDPLSATTRGGELELLLHAGRLEEAAALAGALVDQFPASARILYLAGRVAYHRKRYAEAEAWLGESLALHPHHESERWLCKSLVDAGRLDEAEPRLVELTGRHPTYLLDLAWLHERRGELGRALEAVERYLERFPSSAFALEQQQRLRSQTMDPEQVIGEVQALELLDDPIPEALTPRYLEALLQTGRSAEARRFVQQRCERLAPALAGRMAWSCYRLQAHDLAVDLFLRLLPTRPNDPKLLRSLETAAARAGRLDRLVQAYEALAPDEPRFHGRIKRVRKRTGQE